MWEAVAAILGGAFYGHKIAKEKRQAAAADLQARQDIAVNFGLRMILCAKDEEIKEAVKYMKYDYKEAAYERLQTELTNAFGEDYRKEFAIYGRRPDGKPYSIACDPLTWTKHLVLSQMGKIHWRQYSEGFYLGGPDDVAFTMKIVEQIDRNINKAHLWAHLILDPSTGLTEANRWDPVGKYVRFKHLVPAIYAEDPRAKLW